MGMSTHIAAFIPDTDKKYQKHKRILLTCEEEEVSLPKETMRYFNTKDEYPDINLLDEKLEIKLKYNEHYKDYENGDMEQGFEVDLTKLPKEVTKIRFYNSW